MDHPKLMAHDLHDEDVTLRMSTGAYLTLDLGADGDGLPLAELFVRGNTDRERIECALAIAERIRHAALDLSAQLANGGTGRLQSNGATPDLPPSVDGPMFGAPFVGSAA